MHQLIKKINQQNKKTLTNAQIGSIVDGIYWLQYFHNLAQNFSRQYLALLVETHLIETYPLRKNKPLIDNKHLYVLLIGKVDKRGFGEGSDIWVERDGRVMTLEDSVFLRLPIQQLNYCERLKQFENRETRELTAMILKNSQDSQKHRVAQKLKEFPVFSTLPYPCFTRLVYYSTLKDIPKGKYLHSLNQKVQSLIYIVEGLVKVTLPFTVELSDRTVNRFLQKYQERKQKKAKHQVTVNYSKGDCIGIDQHFSNTPFKTFSIVISVQARILQIPVELFDRVFNQRGNHDTYLKMRHLQKIRAELLEKSLQAQHKKENEIMRWSQEKKSMSPELKKKIINYQLEDGQEMEVRNPEQSTNMSLSKNQSIHKPSKLHHTISRQTETETKNEPRNQGFIQEFYQGKKLQDISRVNLFPKEYSQSFIYPRQRRQLENAQANKNMNLMMYLQPKHHRKVCNRNNSRSKMMFSRQESSFENSLFSMAKDVAHNFALGSTFYRGYFNKGDELSNLNFKTIQSMESSQKTLLLKRRNQFEQPSLDVSQFFLPGLNSKSTLNDFNPMSPRKNTKMDLSQHLVDQKYNVDSKNTLDSRKKSSSHTIVQRNGSADLKDYNKTLFVKTISKQSRMLHHTLDSALSQKRSMKLDSSMLSIK